VKTVLVGWELGAGLGHVMRAATYARALHAAGLRVVVAMPDLFDAARLHWPKEVLIVPAPQPRRSPQGLVNPSTYAELLYGCGYHDVNQVTGLITAWFNLMDLAQADVVLADHAPSAHLAARALNVPSIRIGTGFFAPPANAETPCFRDWHATDALRTRTVERHVLAVVNAALTACGVAESTSLADAIAPDLDLIASAPELDCYASLRPSGSVVYVGHEAIVGQGVAPRWPSATGDGVRRIVAYLKRDYGALAAVLDQLARGHCSVAFVDGLTEKERAQWESANLWLAPEPLDLIEAAKASDLFVCHAGAGSAPLFLAAGKPVLMLPYNAEQRANAVCIDAIGAGRWLVEEEVVASFGVALSDVATSAHYSVSAMRVATEWREAPGAVEAVVARITALLESPDFDRCAG
jgi:hypothetical protein